MIARIWRATASNERVPDYVEHFQNSVYPELLQLKGFEEAIILRRSVGDSAEITVMTLWESMDAIRSFAGDDAEIAVVAPPAQIVLQSFDTTVTHHEVVLNSLRGDSERDVV